MQLETLLHIKQAYAVLTNL